MIELGTMNIYIDSAVGGNDTVSDDFENLDINRCLFVICLFNLRLILGEVYTSLAQQDLFARFAAADILYINFNSLSAIALSRSKSGSASNSRLGIFPSDLSLTST